jgi:hypothetical protein
MSKKAYLYISVVMFVCLSCNRPIPLPEDTIHPKMLTVEYYDNPMGLDVKTPRLSWLLFSKQRGQLQTAYQIIVSSDLDKLQNNIGDIWDSKKIESDQSVLVKYKGKQLKSGMQCFWKVKVWDKKSRESEWSIPSLWSMGILQNDDWKADWISINKKTTSNLSSKPVFYFRKEILTEKEITRATAYFVGENNCKLYINTALAGIYQCSKSVLSNTFFYNSFDISTMLKIGKNIFGIVLDQTDSSIIKNPQILLQVHIEYNDGTEEIITTDNDWKMLDDATLRSKSLRKEFDLNKEITGWNTAGFNDKNWLPVDLIVKKDIELKSYINEPLQIACEFECSDANVNKAYKKKVNEIQQNTVNSLNQFSTEQSYSISNALFFDLSKIYPAYVTNLWNVDSIKTLQNNITDSVIISKRVACVNIINQLFTYYADTSLLLANYKPIQTWSLNLLDSITVVFNDSTFTTNRVLNTALGLQNVLKHLERFANALNYKNEANVLANQYNSLNSLLNQKYSGLDDAVQLPEKEEEVFLSAIVADENNPGFKHFYLTPVVNKNVSFAKTTYNSLYGIIINDWNYNNSVLQWKISVPVNTTATLYIPTIKGTDISENGIPIAKTQGLSFITVEDGYSVYKAESGDYVIQCKIKKQ